MRGFKYSELWANLVTRLYDYSDNLNNLVCSDNQDKPVACPYGFCQLISSDSTSFTRSCVHNSSIGNHYGVIVESKTISKTDIESTVIYTCNKPMCNNSTMAKEVRQLLDERGLLIHSATTTSTTTTTTVTKRSTGNTSKPFISIQWGLIFLITFIFRQ